MTNPELKHSASLLILPVYLGLTIVIGWTTRRQSHSANAYLNASRSLPLWIVTAAYLSANCGALEIVGLSAMAAQYGVQAFHFYWIGAIPAMIFLAIWMMPVYRKSAVRSVPEYLEVRYGPRLRLLYACVLAITMLLLAGISLYAMAQTLEVLVGMTFVESISVSAGVVVAYVLLGGIKATIYNEVFQLAVMIAGIAPVAIRAFLSGGWRSSAGQGPRFHLWTGLPLVSDAAPIDTAGVFLGLGFVLSFGYWCTDFVLMQRAFAARTDEDARRVPLWAGFGKLLFSLLVVIPGLAAARLVPHLTHQQRFDQALPELMIIFYGPMMLGLGLTALTASLMSGLAANVSAFAAIWTEDIYRSRLRRFETDRHYLLVGRAAATAAIVLSMFASYINFLFKDLMEHVQLIFSVVAAPFWAVFLMGMTTRKINENGAIAAFVGGTSVALLHLLAFRRGWIFYGSVMNANFHTALYAFCAALALGCAASLIRRQTAAPQQSLVFHWKASLTQTSGLLWVLSVLLLGACLTLNWIYR